MRPCLLGRCTDDVIGEAKVHRLIEVELASAPKLRAHILIQIAQIQPPAHIGKGIGITVEYLDQRCAHVGISPQAQDHDRACHS